MKTGIQALQCITFRQAEDPESFEEAASIRRKVFGEEQHVTEEQDLDEFDAQAEHFVLLNAGEPVATGRLVEFQELCQSKPIGKIGRLAVLKEHRGQGFGEFLMWAIIDAARANDYEQVVLDAVVPAIPFYETLGFVKEGFEFEEFGHPNFAMRLIF